MPAVEMKSPAGFFMWEIEKKDYLCSFTFNKVKNKLYLNS